MADAAKCDGSSECKAAVHLHGCYSDDGTNCDHPSEHAPAACNCGKGDDAPAIVHADDCPCVDFVSGPLEGAAAHVPQWRPSRGPWYWFSGIWRGCVHCGSALPHLGRWCDEALWIEQLPWEDDDA